MNSVISKIIISLRMIFFMNYLGLISNVNQSTDKYILQIITQLL